MGLADSADRLHERELVRRCNDGERAAQEEVFRLLKHRVHRTLYRIMGSNRQLPDLVQDSFLEVFRSLRTFRGDAKLSTWADTVAARVAYRHLSRRPPRPSHLALVEDLGERRSSEEATLDARKALARLYALLDRLDAKYRITYALHVIDGRPLAEVAQITDVSLSAAKNRASRARRMVHERARRDPLLNAFLLRAEAGS